MKFRKLCYLTLVATMLFAGCGSADTKNNESTDASAENQTVEQTIENQTEEQTGETLANKVSLNVENDTFTLDQLMSQIGAKETDCLTLLGAAEKANSYETMLFGEKVVITLGVESEAIQTIQLDFAAIDMELLNNAISEQAGSDGASENELVKWTLDACTITLQQGDQGCTAMISR